MTKTNTPAPTITDLNMKVEQLLKELQAASYQRDEIDPEVAKPAEGESIEQFAARLVASETPKAHAAFLLVRLGVDIKPLGTYLDMDGGHLNREYKNAVEAMYIEYAPGVKVAIVDGLPVPSYPSGKAVKASVAKVSLGLKSRLWHNPESKRWIVDMESPFHKATYPLAETISKESAEATHGFIETMRDMGPSGLSAVDAEENMDKYRAAKLILRFRDGHDAAKKKHAAATKAATPAGGTEQQPATAEELEQLAKSA